MEPEYEPSPLIPIGDKKYFCVEYPGYVKRPKRAIETLGGAKALNEAFNSDSKVELKYRQGDPFSHPINGQILPTSKLLVKVTRRVKKNGKSESAWDIKVEGVVTKTLRFRALADFQYLLPKEDKICQLKHALKRGDVQHLMNYKIDMDDNLKDLRGIPPSEFTSIDGELSYGYRQSSPVLRIRVKQPDGSFKIKLYNRSLSAKVPITVVRFHEENMPTKSWHNLWEPTKPHEIEVVEEVRKLFEERPIWCRQAVHYRLSLLNKSADFLSPENVRLGLVHNAYRISDGPWRDSWAKYGVDPRSDQKYHIYQQINVQRLVTRDGKIGEKGRKFTQTPSREYAFDGKTIPKSCSTFPICDITDPDLLPLIKNPKYLKSKVTRNSGFYYFCVILRLRAALREKFLSLLKNGTAERINNIEDGIMEEIAKEIEGNGFDGEDQDDVEVIADLEKATSEAMTEIEKPESGKRLKQAVDDYMEELTNQKPNPDGDFDCDFDIVDYDDEALEVFDEDEDNAENNEQIETIKAEEDNDEVTIIEDV